MNQLVSILAAGLLFMGTANGQISSFPYGPYSWTGAASISGDAGYVATADPAHAKPFIPTDTGAYCPSYGDYITQSYSSISVVVDASGKTFTGAETFSFQLGYSDTSQDTFLWVRLNSTILVQGLWLTKHPSGYVYSFTLPAWMSTTLTTIMISIAQDGSHYLTSNVWIRNVSISGGALPIQLSSFSVQKCSTNSMQLTWTTASEINNYGFYVQTSSNMVDWSNIGEIIRGHGTTLEPQKYSLTLPIANGSWWVRLKQVDLDGAFSTSEAQLIEIASPAKFSLNQNYPNPFNPSTQISFSVTKEGPVSLRVYDILGREVATLVNENRKAGQYTELFKGNQMASGVYVYVLRASEGQLTGRMMMLK